MADIIGSRAGARPVIANSTLIKIQAVSGALFFTFLVLHVSNTLVAPLGYEFYNRYQSILRQLYNNPVFEVLFVFLPLLIHATAGVMLYRRRRSKRKSDIAGRLHSWAGFLLLAIIFGHIAATRGLGIFMNAAPSFEGVSFAIWWMPMVFYPYYFILFMAGLYHGLNGISIALNRLGIFSMPLAKNVKRIVLSLGGIGCIFALLAFGGHLHPIPDPTDNDYARAYGSIFGVELTTVKK